MSIQVELHWSPSAQRTGMIGIWPVTQVPTVGELIRIEEPDLHLRLRVTSVHWKFPLGEGRSARLNVESLDF